MKKKSSSVAGIFSPRLFLAFNLFSAAALLAAVALSGISTESGECPAGANCSDRAASAEEPERYMPVPGGEPDDLDRLELEWNSRLTYPTGQFDPAWVREAARQDSLVVRQIPAGLQRGLLTNAPLALNPNAFTALGPQPLQMTGCSGCFDYTRTEGRVNAIAVDPTTTTPGSIVAYIATVGGGVWKTTNCCSSITSWNVLTDDALISTTSVDTLSIDPNNHNTIYAGTGDLNFGSFSMGSQGILKSTDGGSTWVVLGANVFGAMLPVPVGQFPQYQAVGKVRVDPNNSNNVVAGTKTGLYVSNDGGTNWTGPCPTNTFSSQRQDITGLELTNVGGTTRILAAVGTRGFATTVQFNLDQNGANGLYKATLPASGCPSPSDFTLISRNDNGFVFGTAVAGSPYTTGQAMNAGSGVPYGGNTSTGTQLGRMDIAVAPSNSNYIYAQLGSIVANSSSGCGNAAGCQLGAWVSIDAGASWTFMAGSAGGSLRACGSGVLSGSAGGGDYPQNWYDQGIAVDPTNPDRVFFDTFDIWLATRTGTAWYDVSCGYSGVSPKPVHVDQHALAFVPGSSGMLIAGNDGGVHGTVNANAAANDSARPAWFNMDTGINTIEFYSGDISGNFATAAAPQASGGAQDNGSMSVTFPGSPTGPIQWQMGIGGDGFYSRIDPVGTGTNLRFFQGNNSGGMSRCVSNCTVAGAGWTSVRGNWTGDTQSFVLPYDLFHGGIPGGDDCAAAGTPGGCGHLIAATTRVWENISGGNSTMPASSWYITNNPSTQNMTKQSLGNRSYINQVKYSPKFQSVAMLGTNDGNAWIGFNLGTGVAGQANWVNVTRSNAILPNRPILGVALDPTVAAASIPVGYAALGGFDENTPTTTGHVFRVSCDASCVTPAWENKSGNLPNIPVDSIIVNPNFPQQVFAGTDFGLYYTDDITAASPVWSRFNAGLPNVMIWDMQIDRGGTTLSLWTRSRGAFVWPLPSGPVGAVSPTPSPTATATATATASPSSTPTATATATATPTATATATPSATATATPGSTPTATAIPTATATSTPTATATSTPTATATATPVSTPTATATATSIPTATATATATATVAPTATATATATPTATPTSTPTATATAIPTATPTATPAQLLNISTRARVLTGDNNLIGGFIITGNDPKKVLLLAKGPSINVGGTPVPGRMSDPTLELHAGNGALMTSNDNWKDSPERAQIEASGLAPTDDHESAIIRTLAPGVYTGVLTGKDNTTGIALIEIYDLEANNSLLANISSRGLVDTGDNVMIGGFIAGNQSANTRVLVRGIGPSLQGSVPNPLADPILELHDSNGNTLETNDNWKDSPERMAIEATGIPPSHDLESAILKPVSPAGYTAVLRGKNGTGIAVVEIYNLR